MTRCGHCEACRSFAGCSAHHNNLNDGSINNGSINDGSINDGCSIGPAAPATIPPTPETTVATVPPTLPSVTTVASTTPKASNSLRVLVFADTNSDGKSDGDLGIGTAIVEIVAPDGTITRVPVSVTGEIVLTGIAPGNYTIRVVSSGTDGKATTRVLGAVIVADQGEARMEFGFAATPAPVADLALTGSSTVTLVFGALALLALGMLLVALSKRIRGSRVG